MAEPAKVIPIEPIENISNESSRLRDIIATSLSQEIVIGIVGYAGSGTSFTLDKFSKILKEQGFTPKIIKARQIIEDWAQNNNIDNPAHIDDIIKKVTEYQNIGDQLREESGEYGAISGWMAQKIHEFRQHKNEDEKLVFLLDSLKHPAEVELLRQIYSDGFRLIGIGCRPDVRQTRLETKFKTDNDDLVVQELINRDSEDSVNKHGQQVNKTFHLSDFFIDNTPSTEDQENFTLPDTLKEMFEKLFTNKTFHPSIDEQGQYFADAAAINSACLSRQVGASIIDQNGNLLAVGRNDVPKADGGLYDNDNDTNDGRCHFRGECSNKKYQNKIIDDIVKIFDLSEMPNLGEQEDTFRKALKLTRMGSLIEFSRSVHAEMDALISLTRTGIKLPLNSTLYSTTYPCHNCARHIIASGIKRVVYLEPYKKSLAIDLHDDAIADNLHENKVKGRVIFEPYVGVAPRLYQTIYRQTGERKDGIGRALYEENGRNLRSRLLNKTFHDLETECDKFILEQNHDRGI